MLGLWGRSYVGHLVKIPLGIVGVACAGDFFPLRLSSTVSLVEGWASYCYTFASLSVSVRAVEGRMNSSEDQVQYFYSLAAFLLEQYSFLRVYVRGSKNPGT